MAVVIAAEPVPLMTDTDGIVRVAKTRVPLHTVISAFLSGATPEEIAQQYPSLNLADVYAVIAYYLQRRSDVDAYLRERQRRAEGVRRGNEQRHDPAGG